MMDTKLTRLVEILRDMQSAVLAYSGGVDSTFLLKALQISGIRTLAITAVSEITPNDDLFVAKKMTSGMGMKHRIIEMDTMLREEFLRNTPERCFFCKDKLFKKLTAISSAGRYTFLLDGSNVDDTMDYRPGIRALSKYHVRSPLTEAGLWKKEIRELSRQLDLSTWDRPSSPCLVTRFPYGQRITKGALERVGRAEDFLRRLGFHEVRVRVHDEIARIEVDKEEIGPLLTSERRSLISEKLKSLGYQFVSLDLDGYRRGSMNRMLEKEYLLEGKYD
jgi:uncharacterized protein